jgi:hypothetical protein
MTPRLTAGALIVLLWHMQAVSRMSGIAAATIMSSADFRALRIQLVVHAAGGLLVNCNSCFASKFEEPFDKLRVNGQGTSRSW